MGDVQLFDEPPGVRKPALLARVGALVETPSLYGRFTGYVNLE